MRRTASSSAGWALLLLMVPFAASPAPAQEPAPLRVAVLDDDIPGLDRQLVEQVHVQLADAGVAVTSLTAEQLADPSVFCRETQDLLVLTNSPLFPGQAGPSLTRFLEAGGHLVLLGGTAFATPLCRVRGNWLDRDRFAELLAAVPTAVALPAFEDGDLTGWNRATNRPEHPSRLTTAPGAEGHCLRLELRDLGKWQWDTYATRLATPIPADQDLLCLHARGPSGTPQVVIEVDETDGSRWMATVALTREWRRHALQSTAFGFFKDGSPEGRGGPGDHLHLDRAARISFGLASGLAQYPDGDHIIEIDEVGTARNDLGAGLADFPAPNRVCFDDYEPYLIRDAVRVTACPGQKLAQSGVVYEGSVEGLSAVGFTLWDRSELLPLLQAEDRYGRRRGWACSTLVHYGGRFKGGCWLLSGVTTAAFYRSEAFRGCLAGFAKAVHTGNLITQSAERNELLKQTALPLQTPAPGPLRRSEDRRQFVLPNGRPLFMIGCNYIGSLDRKFFGGPWLHWLEQDFRRAHEAGLNCMRIYGASTLYRDPVKLQALRECARKWGIYLLIVVADHTDLLTREELSQRCVECARAFADEPMLLGYDLQNEPYTYKPAEVRDGEQTLGERYPLWQRWEEYARWAGLQMEGNFTSFPGVTGPLPRDEQWGPVLDATDGVFSDWIRWQVEAIRTVDKTHPITVGYNTVYDCLPANRQLDFVSHHAYQPPTSLDEVRKNLTTLDRLRSVWPDRPISLGEFGYTNGLEVDGRYLDLHTSAVGEFLHYLYAYSHGFSGCMKWALTDHPLELSRQQCTWRDPDDLAAHISEGRFGLFYSDGTQEPQPKPLVWALRVLRQYVDSGGEPGELRLVAAPTQIGTGYVFRAPRALFVGNVSYESPELCFTAAKAANVLLRWGDASLRLVSTADARIRPNLRALLGGETGGDSTTTGKAGSVMRDGEWLQIEALEGEAVEVRW